MRHVLEPPNTTDSQSKTKDSRNREFVSISRHYPIRKSLAAINGREQRRLRTASGESRPYGDPAQVPGQQTKTHYWNYYTNNNANSSSSSSKQSSLLRFSSSLLRSLLYVYALNTAKKYHSTHTYIHINTQNATERQIYVWYILCAQRTLYRVLKREICRWDTCSVSYFRYKVFRRA